MNGERFEVLPARTKPRQIRVERLDIASDLSAVKPEIGCFQQKSY